jgi:hypothetical protein
VASGQLIDFFDFLSNFLIPTARVTGLQSGINRSGYSCALVPEYANAVAAPDSIG